MDSVCVVGLSLFLSHLRKPKGDQTKTLKTPKNKKNTKKKKHHSVVATNLKTPQFHVSDPVIRIPRTRSISSCSIRFVNAMTRRCSHCSHNGHNSRTCPNRGVKLFGVRLTDGSIRKSASMGNLTHYAGSGSGPLHAGSNNPGSPGETPDHAAAADGYASEDFVPGSSSTSRERKKGSFLHP